MIYPTSMENLNAKLFILWATQKRKNLIRFENMHTQIHIFIIFM